MTQIEKNIFQTYLTDLKIKSHDLNTSLARKIFERAVAEYLDKKISLDSLSIIASEILYSNNIVNNINSEDPDLANILTFTAELEWDINNNKERYENTIKKIVLFGQK